MMRRFLTILSVLFLLLCVLIWVRSHFSADTLSLVRTGIDKPHDHGDISNAYQITSGCGAIRFEFRESEDRNRGTDLYAPEEPPPPKTTRLHWFASSPRFFDVERSTTGPGWRREFAGLAAGRETYMGNHAGSDLWYFEMPLWVPAVLLILCPARRTCSSLQRLHRARHNLCLTCGYDLRASKDRCPECGNPIPPPGVKNTT